MPKEFGRHQRVADVIHKALAQIILREIPAGEFGMITISAVKVSAGLDYAKIYITILNETSENIFAVLEMLEENNKFIRHLLSQAVKLRITPQLKFFYDESQTHARHITSLINDVIKGDKK